MSDSPRVRESFKQAQDTIEAQVATLEEDLGLKVNGKYTERNTNGILSETVCVALGEMWFSGYIRCCKDLVEAIKEKELKRVEGGSNGG